MKRAAPREIRDFVVDSGNKWTKKWPRASTAAGWSDFLAKFAEFEAKSTKFQVDTSRISIETKQISIETNEI